MESAKDRQAILFNSLEDIQQLIEILKLKKPEGEWSKYLVVPLNSCDTILDLNKRLPHKASIPNIKLAQILENIGAFTDNLLTTDISNLITSCDAFACPILQETQPLYLPIFFPHGQSIRHEVVNQWKSAKENILYQCESIHYFYNPALHDTKHLINQIRYNSTLYSLLLTLFKASIETQQNPANDLQRLSNEIKIWKTQIENYLEFASCEFQNKYQKSIEKINLFYAIYLRVAKFFQEVLSLTLLLLFISISLPENYWSSLLLNALPINPVLAIFLIGISFILTSEKIFLTITNFLAKIGHPLFTLKISSEYYDNENCYLETSGATIIFTRKSEKEAGQALLQEQLSRLIALEPEIASLMNAVSSLSEHTPNEKNSDTFHPLLV